MLAMCDDNTSGENTCAKAFIDEWLEGMKRVEEGDWEEEIDFLSWQVGLVFGSVQV